jgi:hypothetical protein
VNNNKQERTQDMNNDPLGLGEMPTPQIARQQRAAPLSHIAGLHSRIINRDCADSLEVKVMLLAHLIYAVYVDLKDINVK